MAAHRSEHQGVEGLAQGRLIAPRGGFQEPTASRRGGRTATTIAASDPVAAISAATPS